MSCKVNVRDETGEMTLRERRIVPTSVLSGMLIV